MKKAVYLLTLLLSLGVVYSVYAQKEQKDDKEKKKKKVYKVPVYLGNTNIKDTAIPHYVFDSLLATKITARDSNGSAYQIHGYLFTYGERNLYEDSVGNLMWVTDLLSEYCYGDTMTSWLLGAITDRTKYGDTIYFDQIKTTSPEGKPVDGKPMRIVLTK